MNHIKHIIFTHYRTLTLLFVSICLSIILLMVRMKLRQSFFFLFLVWNLFLAVIPYVISIVLANNKRISKWAMVFSFGIWLLFLPNAAYIITDFLHLHGRDSSLLWLDALVVASFAANGLVLFYLSISDMVSVLKRYTKPRYAEFLVPIILLLSSFGVYMGRFLRYNSWEIIQNPFAIFFDVMDIILHPSVHSQAWLFTFIYGVFLSVGYWMFKMLKQNTLNSEGIQYKTKKQL